MAADLGRRLPRHLGKPDTMDAGMWCRTEIETMAGIERSSFVRCWECGTTSELCPTYQILRYSGLVSPRWQCSNPKCSVLERLQLEAHDQ